MDYSGKIFEILGLKPGERFRIKGKEDKYYITEDLFIKWVSEDDEDNWCISDERIILKLLRGTLEIDKSIPWTEDEKTVAKFAKLNGTEFIARDDSGTLWMYENMPNRSIGGWGTVGKITDIYANMPHITTDRVYTTEEILEGE